MVLFWRHSLLNLSVCSQHSISNLISSCIMSSFQQKIIRAVKMQDNAQSQETKQASELDSDMIQFLELLHRKFKLTVINMGFPGGATGNDLTCQCSRCKRHGFDQWIGKTPGEGHSNPLQYSCLENAMDRGAWWAIVHWVAKSWTRLKWLNTWLRY